MRACVKKIDPRGGGLVSFLKNQASGALHELVLKFEDDEDDAGRTVRRPYIAPRWFVSSNSIFGRCVESCDATRYARLSKTRSIIARLAHQSPPRHFTPSRD